jgi:lysophospholipase L1-like esterase
MVGYWIIVALIALAVAATVVASTVPDQAPAPATATAGRAPLRWVVLAASDAAPGPEGPTWPELIVADLPPGAVALRNAAVGGITIDLARSEVLPSVLAEEFDAAVVWLAVNDLAAGRPLPEYLADLDALLGALSGPGHRVAVANIPDLGSLPALTAFVPAPALRAVAAAWNDGIAEVAARHGAEVIDLGGSPVPPENLSADGFHPSPAGQRSLADIFGPWVKAQLIGE